MWSIISLEEFFRKLRNGESSKFHDVVVDGTLNLSNCSIKNNLGLRNVAVRGDLYLNGITVEGDLLELENTTVDGDLYLGEISVGQSITLKNTTVKGEIFCTDPVLALQCFLYFGKKVHLPTKILREWLQICNPILTPT